VLLLGSPPWLRRLVWAARWLGLFGLVLHAVCAIRHMTAPYPLFQSSLWWLQNKVVAVYTALWGAGIAFLYRLWRRGAEESDTFLAGAVIDGVITGAACLGVCLAIPCVNALLDRSPLASIPVEVTNVRWRKMGAKSSTTHPFATVHRLDNKGDDVVLDWGSCKPAPPESSPLATLRVGTGALGASWISLPVLCRPPAVGDRPLVSGLSLGKGSPAVVVILKTDATRDDLNNRANALTDAISPLSDPSLTSEAYFWRLQGVLEDKDVAKTDILTAPERAELKRMLETLGNAKPAKRRVIVRRATEFAKSSNERREARITLPRWIDTANRARPGVSILIIYDSSPPNWATSMCADNCRMVPRKAVDSEIFELFAKPKDLWHEDLLYLADGGGQNVFSSGLSDLEKRPECAKILERTANATR
jgi:hypothetical protein